MNNDKNTTMKTQNIENQVNTINSTVVELAEQLENLNKLNNKLKRSNNGTEQTKGFKNESTINQLRSVLSRFQQTELIES